MVISENFSSIYSFILEPNSHKLVLILIAHSKIGVRIKAKVKICKAIIFV